MAKVYSVWTEYHIPETMVSESPELVALHMAEDKGLEDTPVLIVVRCLLDGSEYRFYANELDYTGV